MNMEIVTKSVILLPEQYWTKHFYWSHCGFLKVIDDIWIYYKSQQFFSFLPNVCQCQNINWISYWETHRFMLSVIPPKIRQGIKLVTSSSHDHNGPGGMYECDNAMHFFYCRDLFSIHRIRLETSIVTSLHTLTYNISIFL